MNTRKNVSIFGRSKINTRFHEIIVNFSAATENTLRKKVYDISSTFSLHTDHHWLFERNIYTHFQYIATFNNNMRCEKLKAREREKLFLLREEENVECGGYQRAMRLHREVDQIFSYHPCISSLKIKKFFCMICFTIVLLKILTWYHTYHHTYIQTHAHTSKHR